MKEVLSKTNSICLSSAPTDSNKVWGLINGWTNKTCSLPTSGWWTNTDNALQMNSVRRSTPCVCRSAGSSGINVRNTRIFNQSTRTANQLFTDIRTRS